MAGIPSLSLFVMVMFEGRTLARLCVLYPDGPVASTAFVANYRFVPAI